MKQRNLGKSGLKVSAVGLGCNNLGGRVDRDQTLKLIPAALEVGINFFDTADIYPVGKPGLSEEYLGDALHKRRHEAIVATKFAGPMDKSGMSQGGSRRYIMLACEASLRRLKTDYIDLFQMHFPDPETPVEETLRALDDLVHQGKVRYFGCSNMPAWQTVGAVWTARELGINGFVSHQDEYSVLVRDIERDLIPALNAYGMGFLPYFPLASGLLTGKYKRNAPMPKGRLAGANPLSANFVTDENWEIVEKLEDFATARGHTVLELAFSWLLAKAPVTSVIAGATTEEQLAANAKAGDWEMTAEEVAEIDKIAPFTRPKKIH